MQAALWDRLSLAQLYLDRTNTRLDLDRSQVENFYLPLAAQLIGFSHNTPRLMVAIAGPPGSGKTAFGMILVATINAIAEAEIAITIGLDGWHFPSQILLNRYLEVDEETRPLISLKGIPESFDAQAAYACFTEICNGGEVRYPIYNRLLHDPEPRAGLVRSSDKIIVIEGNYLLLAESPWQNFQDIFAVRIFINADPQSLLESLAERHLRGGKTPEDTFKHIQEVDLPNAQRILTGSPDAHIIVHKRDPKYIVHIEWVNGT